MKPLTHNAVWDNRENILEIVVRLRTGELTSNTHDVVLHDNHIKQVSIFQTDGPNLEKVVYCGIHKLDEEGEIIAGAGINLTQKSFKLS